MSQRSLLDAHQQPCQRIRNKKAADMNQQLLLYKEWSWRDSNPRPHKETIRFLHAYSSLQFSRYDKTWTTNHTLIL